MTTSEFKSARTPRVQAQMGSVKLTVGRVRVMHSINVLPSVKLELQVGAGDSLLGKLPAVDIDLKRFGVLNRVLQERILNEFGTAPDLQVRLDDGDGNERVFTGFSGNPTFDLQNGGVGLGLDGVHEMIALTGFSGAIYTQQVNRSEFYAVLQEAEADNIGVIVQRLLRHLVSGYVGAGSGKLGVTPVHSLNEKLLTYAEKFLAYSQVGTKFADLGSDAMGELKPMLDQIKAAVVQAPHLLAAFDMIRSMFVFQMNSSWDGKAWMEQIRTMDDPSSQVIRVPTSSVRFNLAGLFRIPVVQLIMLGQGAPHYAVSGELGTVDAESGDAATLIELLQSSNNSLGMVGRYPRTLPKSATGRYEFMQAPGWLPSSATRTLDQRKVEASGSKAEQALAAVKAEVDRLNRRQTAQQSVIDWLVEMEFRNRYLADTTAEISLPMNLQVQPGYTYMVESVSGAPLFSGYLVNAEHDLAIAPDGGGGQASTRLAFSHVRAPDAVINALKAEAQKDPALSEDEEAVLEGLC